MIDKSKLSKFQLALLNNHPEIDFGEFSPGNLSYQRGQEHHFVITHAAKIWIWKNGYQLTTLDKMIKHIKLMNFK